MNIGINNKLPIAEVSRPKDKINTEKSASNTQKTGTVSDSVSLSIDKALASIKETPRVNVERVAQLKNAIENGDYKINANRVANNIIRSEQELNTG